MTQSRTYLFFNNFHFINNKIKKIFKKIYKSVHQNKFLFPNRFFLILFFIISLHKDFILTLYHIEKYIFRNFKKIEFCVPKQDIYKSSCLKIGYKNKIK